MVKASIEEIRVEQAENKFGVDALPVQFSLEGFVFRKEVDSDQIAKAYWEKAFDKLNSGDFGVGTLVQVLKYDNDKVRRLIAKGLTKYAQGDFAGAEKYYKKAIEIDPEDAAIRNNLGAAMAAQGKHAEAVTCYERAAEISPEYAAIHYNLGITKAAQGKYAEAVTCYEKAIVINPEKADAYNNLGNAKAAQKDFSGAVDAYKKVVEINPEYVIAYYNIGNAKYIQEDFSGAVDAYEKAIEINPENATAHYWMGKAKHDHGDLSGAVDAYENAIKINPEDAAVHYSMGKAKHDLGDFSGAVDAYENAIKINPEDVAARLNLGNDKHIQGDFSGAAEDYLKAMKIEPILASDIAAVLLRKILVKEQESREMDKKHLADVLEDELVQKLMLGDENFTYELGKQLSEKMSPDIDDKRIFSAISTLLEAKNREIKTYKEHAIGLINKENSDDFARKMGEPLESVRKEGFTSTRKISDRFNELNIPSAKGGKWSHNTVKNLILRRRALGFEGPKNE